MHKPTDWQVRDLVDFEVFLAEDNEIDEKTLAVRDRELFQTGIAPKLGSGASGRRERLRLWLEARRNAGRSGESTPGDYFRQAYRSLITLLAVAGFVLGSGLAASHLYYYGSQPINAMVFFASTAGSQIAILALLVAGVLFHRSLSAFEGFAVVRWAVSGLLLWIARRREALLNGEARLRFASAIGLLRARRATYGSLALWPLFVATQTFAILFNAGVLLTLFLLVAFSNRAFGWETTNVFTPAGIHDFVRWMAFPWSWLVPHAYPTLGQVRHSQIALHGPGVYTAEALASWWPFLFYAVLFYGMLPRLGLLFFSRSMQRRALRTLSFDRPDCNRLLRRMTPLVDSDPDGPDVAIDKSAGQPMPIHLSGGNCLAIVSRELTFPDSALAESVRRLGWSLARRFDAEIDNANGSADLFKAVAAIGCVGSDGLLVVAGEGHDPIKAVLKFLTELRAAAGRTTEIIVLLIPENRNSGDRLTIWKRVINTLGDPLLSVERAVNS